MPLNVTASPKMLADANVQATILNPAIDAAGNPAKLSFFGVAPIAQPAASGNTHTVAAGSTTQVYADTTFDGGVGGTAYTFGDIVAALKELGLVQISPTTLSLRNLSLSQSIFNIGTPSSGSIFEATAGSTITASGLPASITINGGSRSFAYDGTGSASSGSFTLTETLAAAVNSPNVSTINYTLSSGAINAPTYAIHTALGVAPTTWDVTGDSTFTPGMWVHQQFAADSGFTTSLVDYYTQIEGSEWEATSTNIGGAASVGIAGAQQLFVNPTGTYYSRCRFETVPADATNNTVSGWSNTVTDTITSSVATWSAAAADKSSFITLSGTNSLTATMNAATNSESGVRTTVAGTGKRHWELTIGDFNAGATPLVTLGVIGSSSSSHGNLSGNVQAPGGSGASAPLGSRCSFQSSTATATITRNGGSQSVTLTGSVHPVAGDTAICEFDATANTITYYFRPVATGVVQTLASITLTSLIPDAYYGFFSGFTVSGGHADAGTANFGATSFLMTPTTGYSGW